MTNEMLEKVEMRVIEVQKQLKAVGYPTVIIESIVAKLKPRVAGTANCFARVITISEDYLREHEAQTLHRTVAHEVCHIYTKYYFPFAKQAHGPEFRRLMDSIKVDSSTYHDMKLKDGPTIARKTKTRFLYKTVITGRVVNLTPQQHKKALRGVTFTSKGEKISFTGQTKTWK